MFKTHMFIFLSVAMMLIRPSWAQTACAAEANFQGCKSIQETKLSGCGPVDFACQCAAHKLIQECYNLCPTYAADATAHDGTVQSICGAVPASSSLPLPSATSLLPSASQQSAPAASSGSPTQQQNQQHSGVSILVPFPTFILGLALILVKVIIN
ncbi:hypothetical protein BCR42DRAFT_448752 [Absidia repens]|uniref:Extracellular membrane protein CFEM domain-containing protein n=1 Tax=Absidia repens TaxID=90262 RepID=A0A1X2IQC0_9FUNG|nr:hypothetical protein BCR42DRAFT_448752 [Absidia repens]